MQQAGKVSTQRAEGAGVQTLPIVGSKAAISDSPFFFFLGLIWEGSLF